MYFNFTVDIPESNGKIIYKQVKDTVYVHYEYDRIYIKEKQYTNVKRTTIGKVCKTNSKKMYPNGNFLKFFPDASLPEEEVTSRSSTLHIGAYLVILLIVKEYKLDEILREIIGADSSLFLDLCAYTIICENNAAQYYPYYTYDHVIFTDGMRRYSDSKVSNFLSTITIEQSQKFLNEWNAKRNHREKIYISYDSTNKNCQAGDIDIAEHGHSKSGNNKPIINFAIAYDKNNKEPLFYEDYNGSIVDVSQLQQMIEAAKGYGYKKVGFILDRGYFSKGNIQFMDENSYDFMIMVKGMKPLVRDLVLEKRGTFELDRKTKIQKYRSNGITVKQKLYDNDKRERYIHLFFNNNKQADQRDRLEAEIDRAERYLDKHKGKIWKRDPSFDEYFELIFDKPEGPDQRLVDWSERTEIVNQKILMCGYFCIVTSAKMEAKDALVIYKSRDASEKLFRGDKSYLGDNTLRVYSEGSAEAKIFLEFVALTIRNRIYTYLLDAVEDADCKRNYMTVPAALKELEQIEATRRIDGVYRLDHAVTKTQKEILKAFGLDENYVKKMIRRLNKQIHHEGEE